MGRKVKKVQKKKNSKIGWIVIVVVAVALAYVFSGVSPFGKSEGKTKSFYVTGGEKRPTLDPSLFTGMTRAAYAAAKEYPQVLDQVYCYCNCDQPPFNHVSLLSCFVDNHGAG
jgi:ABC-type sugar transport system substrate-binding protein